MIDRNKHFPVRHFGGHWAIGHWPRLEAIVRYVRSLLLTHSPAVVANAWIDTLGLGLTSYVSHMPDGDGQDNVMCVYDTGARIHGKDRNASVHQHFIVNFRVRHNTFRTARAYLRQLVDALNAVSGANVTIGDHQYEIVTASQIRYSYTGHDKRRRSIFDASFAMNMYEMVRV